MSGRGRLGAAFGPAGLREQIGQQMMRHGGPLPLATVRKLFDDAAEDGDTGEVCQSVAVCPWLSVCQWRKGRKGARLSLVALHRALLSALRCMLCGTCSSGVDHGSHVGTGHLHTTSFATATRDSLPCLASVPDTLRANCIL